MNLRDTHDIDSDLAVARGKLDVLAKRKRDVQILEEQVQKMSEGIKEEEEELNRRILTLINSKSPINRIAAQVLLSIFEFYCEAIFFDSSLDGTGKRVLPAPLTLSHVCSHWKSVIYSTTLVWRYLPCTTGDWHDNALKTVLERSATQPLAFRYTQGPMIGERADDVPYVLDQLKERLQFLSLTFRLNLLERGTWNRTRLFQNLTTLDGSLNKTNGDATLFPLLQTLSLSLSLSDRNAVTPPDLQGLKMMGSDRNHCPRLKSLVLESFPLTNLNSLISQHLTSLQLTYPTYDKAGRKLEPYFGLSDFLDFVKNGVNLERLTLRDAVPRYAIANYLSQSNGATPPVTLPSLRHFEWSYPNAKEVRPLFNFLEMPNLQELQISFDEPTALSQTDDPEFLSGSRCFIMAEVTTLSLSFKSQETFSNALALFAFPSLKKLEIASQRVRSSAQPLPRELPSFFPAWRTLFTGPPHTFLTEFSLSYFNLTTADEVILGFMPNLTYLSFDTCRGVENFLDRLTQTQHPTSSSPQRQTTVSGIKFCSKLEALFLWNCSTVTGQMITALIESREPQNPAISSLKNTTVGQDKPSPRKIRELPRRKLNVEVVAPTSPTSTLVSSGVVAARRLLCVSIIECGGVKANDVDAWRDKYREIEFDYKP